MIFSKKISLAYLFCCTMLFSSPALGFSKRSFYMSYGINFYLHDPSDVIADNGAAILGRLNNLNVNISFADFFADDLFFYRVMLNFDYSIPKVVDTSGIRTTINQLRGEAPLLFGVSFDVNGHKFYAATGPNFTYYQLNHHTRSSSNTESRDDYQFISWGFTSLVGIMVRVSDPVPKRAKKKKKKKRKRRNAFQHYFFMEILYSTSSGTGHVDTNTEQFSLGEFREVPTIRRNVQINLSDLRWNIGYSHTI